MNTFEDAMNNLPNKGTPIPGTPYKVGDYIGHKWIVLNLVGVGGMGIVYLVYERHNDLVRALKSFKEEYLDSPDIRKAFRKEVELWIELGRYPYIVEASFVSEVSERLFVEMDYIPPNKGMTGSSLSSFIEKGHLKEEQILNWAIQFCYGMDHAYSHGITCHRDIKPGNILIDQQGKVRIADFGLAKALDGSSMSSFSEVMDVRSHMSSSSNRRVCGTPPYMPPEQFHAKEADVRNDMYSFGVVLFEMTTGRLPFWVNPPRNLNPEAIMLYWEEWEKVHRHQTIPEIEGDIGKLIRKCVAKKPEERYQSFSDLRTDLTRIYQNRTGSIIEAPQINKTETSDTFLRKGTNLNALGHYQEALTCFNKVLEINPRSASAWNNKAISLGKMGQLKEAELCFDRVIELRGWDGVVWGNKAANLDEQGRYQEAILYYDKAIELDPNYPFAWNNKGLCLNELERYEEAIACFNKAIELDPRYVKAWIHKGEAYENLGLVTDALRCYNKALNIDPQSDDALFHKKKLTE